MKHDIRTFISYIQLIKGLSKNYFILVILSALVQTAQPFVNIIMLRFIIDELTVYKVASQLIMYISIMVIGNLVIGLLDRLMARSLELKNHLLMADIELQLGKKIMDVHFKYLEDAKVLNLREQVMFFINNKMTIVGLLNRFIQSVVGLIGFLIIVVTMNVYILLLVVAVVIFNSYIYKKMKNREFEHEQNQVLFNRKWSYYIGLAINFFTAKDIRLYNISPFIMNKTKKYHEDAITANDKITHYKGKSYGISSLAIQIQNAAIVAYAAYRVFKQNITIGQFTMYISSANLLSNHLTELTRSVIEFRQMCKHIDNFITFNRVPEPDKDGNRIFPNDLKLEFKNVSFSYNDDSSLVLKNVSIILQMGEKLAIVGPNGAGKTTFIKLLCRLYKPQAGEILLGGKNIQTYDYEEYMKLLSVVFQDYKLLPFSIRENLDNESQRSEDGMEEVLKQVGLFEKIQEIPKRLNTSIYKTLDSSGIELSGGQYQKLVIARNILKDAPILILDEPTSSLDPYAEAEIYQHFNVLAKGRTTIYISHRMSSCTFCDKVAVFDQGEIVEYGTHQELLNKKKVYAGMWHAQATYYN
ncbi:ABC transporter ATP-binding protein [Paenibacillus sp. FSL P4-0338]|uniref:ABC transporter ATP-binding protein n=1 Tax=unclassified Paenibacillus TaxID=185978 RepID=UPI0003E21E2E|nr:ABC transporter ATP-binding protein [Paenibacillus sp. FSL R7-269]ETT48453.1 ABC transporter [Paenibacillus sp. FSL R7-269]